MHAQSPPGAHLAWVDVLKGLGICAVVAGHTLSGLPSQLMYMFHMPLFFLVGGYLFRPRADGKTYAISKSIHLLLPYAVFLITFELLRIASLAASPSFGVGVLMAELGQAALGGRGLTGWTGVFWFVTCFYLTQQLANLASQRWSTTTVSLIALGMYALSFVNSRVFPEHWWPWNANVVLAAFPLFWLGYLAKQAGMQPTRKWLVLSLVGTCAGASLLVFGRQNIYDMKIVVYGLPVVTLVSAVSAVVLLAGLARISSSLPWLAKPLGKLGQGSMIIMYLHQPIQISLRKVVAPEPIRFGITLLAAALVYEIIRRFTVGRAFLLGSERDFRTCFDRGEHDVGKV